MKNVISLGVKSLFIFRFLYSFHNNKRAASPSFEITQVAQQYRADTARYHPMLMSIGKFDLYRPVSIDVDQYWIHNFKMCEKFDIWFFKRTFFTPGK